MGKNGRVQTNRLRVHFRKLDVKGLNIPALYYEIKNVTLMMLKTVFTWWGKLFPLYIFAAFYDRTERFQYRWSDKIR